MQTSNPQEIGRRYAIFSMSCHKDFSCLCRMISPIMARGFEKMPIWKPMISRSGPIDTQASCYPSTSSPNQILETHNDQVRFSLASTLKRVQST